jgi:tetratricopeptide (TPR) repeat protein
VYEPDLDNLRAALGWSFGKRGDPALGVNLASLTDQLWRELSLLREQRRWFDLALTRVDDATLPAVEARIRIALGWSPHAGDRGRLAHNLRAAELIKRVGGEPALLGQALDQAGLSTIRYRDGAEAEQYYDEALSVLRRCGRTKRLATALLGAGTMRKDTGDLQAAQALVEESGALSEVLGDVRVQFICEVQLATIAFEAGRLSEAIDRARRAVEASSKHGIHATEFLAQYYLAAFLILDDQIGPGRVAALRAFELSRALGNVGLPGSIDRLALVLAVHRETGTAARLAGFADGYVDRHQLGRSNIARAVRSRLVEHIHSAMNPQECQAAMAAGAAWSEQEAVSAAMAA